MTWIVYHPRVLFDRLLVRKVERSFVEWEEEGRVERDVSSRQEIENVDKKVIKENMRRKEEVTVFSFSCVNPSLLFGIGPKE